MINGQAKSFETEKGYAVLKRTWKKGDKVSLLLPMETEKVLANQQVKDDRGRFAFERGPIVYCLEGPDNKDSLVQNILIDRNAIADANYHADLLNGVDVISAEGKSAKRQLKTDSILQTDQMVKAIPYYAWANRGPSEMTVWIPYETSAVRPKPAPTIASTSKVSASLKNVRMFAAIKDQYEPADSKDTNYPYLHWWPAKNTNEFVQYDFDTEHTVSESKVYWYDDGPWGGCRIPVSYKILYKKDGQWVPVKNTTPYTINKDSFNVVTFEPVATTALRMEIQLPVDNSTGIHEWAVK
ncbi:discoidin domain-containing protein [Mucilaginibacter sp. UC70_90]